MSYDATFLLPLLVVGLAAGLLALIGSGWLRLLSGLLGVAACAVVLMYGLDGSAMYTSSAPPAVPWDAEVALGIARWDVHRRAGSYLAWSLPPLLPSALALGLWVAERRHGRGRRAIPVAAALGVPLLLAALLGARWATPYVTGTWPMDDVRWEWGYVAACLDNPVCADFEEESACSRLEVLLTERADALAKHATPARIEAARAFCAGG